MISLKSIRTFYNVLLLVSFLVVWIFDRGTTPTRITPTTLIEGTKSHSSLSLSDSLHRQPSTSPATLASKLIDIRATALRNATIPVPWDVSRALIAGHPELTKEGFLYGDSPVIKLLDINQDERQQINRELKGLPEEVFESEKSRAQSVREENGDAYILIDPDPAFHDYVDSRLNEIGTLVLGEDRGPKLASLLMNDVFYRNDSEPRRLFFFEQQLTENYRALRFGVERLDGNGEVIGDPKFMEWSKVSHGHGVHGLLKGRYDHLLDFEAWKNHVQKNWQENYFQR